MAEEAIKDLKESLDALAEAHKTPSTPPTPAVPPTKVEEKKAEIKAETQAALDARAKAAEEQKPVLTRQQKLADLCEQHFLRVQELSGANFSHRGFCSKCGWQTMQHTKEEAHVATRQHVLTHWKDIAAQVA